MTHLKIEAQRAKPHRLSLAHPTRYLLLATFAFTLTAAGCSSRTPASPGSPAESTEEKRGDWFCQPATQNAQDPWECVQDKALAKNPKPDRLPNADDEAPNEDVFRDPATAPIEVDAELPPPPANESDLPLPDNPPPPPPPGLSQRQSADPPSAINSSAAQDSTLSKPSATTSPNSASKRSRAARPLPDYIRLAYQPTEPVSILELPSHFYAVQLVALSSADNILGFIEKHKLNNLTAAKVAIDGTIRYVLILGIYESRDKAELAAAGQRPAPLAEFTPWIRKLSNLQKAMYAAEQQENA